MNDLRLMDAPGGGFESKAGLHLVEALPAGCTGINEKHTRRRIHTLDAQDVAVPTDENVRRIHLHRRHDSMHPAAGITTDVRHPEIQSVYIRPEVLRSAMTNFLAIDISPDGARRGYGLQRVENVWSTDIPRMQDQVDISKILRDGGMEVAVRVRNDAEKQGGRDLVVK